MYVLRIAQTADKLAKIRISHNEVSCPDRARDSSFKLQFAAETRS